MTMHTPLNGRKCEDWRLFCDAPSVFSRGRNANDAERSYSSNCYYWCCPHNMLCTVYVTVGCPSVRQSARLSVDICRLPQPGRGQQISIDSCMQAPELRLRVASCWEPRCEAQHRLVKYAVTANWPIMQDHKNPLSHAMIEADQYVF